MSFYRVEDSLEEFSTRHLESYNLALRRMYLNTAPESCCAELASFSALRELSSPFISNYDFNDPLCATIDVEIELANNKTMNFNSDSDLTWEPVNNTMDAKDPKISCSFVGRPPLKPSVTIASINTINELQRTKWAKNIRHNSIGTGERRSVFLSYDHEETSRERMMNDLILECLSSPMDQEYRNLYGLDLQIPISDITEKKRRASDGMIGMSFKKLELFSEGPNEFSFLADTSCERNDFQNFEDFVCQGM